MRRIAVVLMVAFAVAFVPAALGQQTCQDFRALYHMILYVDLTSTPPSGGWMMDADDPVSGLLDLQPVSPTLGFVQPPASNDTGKVGHDRDTVTTWDFGDGDTITISDWHAVYPNQPGKAGLWTYNGTGKITGGTGKFNGATGTLNETGPYLIWFDFGPQGPTTVHGKYHATIVARICTN